MNVLEKLKADFAGLAPREVDLPGLEEPVFVHPLTGEEAFALAQAAKNSDGRAQALGFAHLAVRKTKDAEGNAVFSGVKAAEDLAKRCGAEVLQRIIEAWTKDGVAEEAEEVEKKSDSLLDPVGG